MLTPRLGAFLTCTLALLAIPGIATGQGPDPFRGATVQLVTALMDRLATPGRIDQAIEAMAQGLAAWDRDLAALEAQLRAQARAAAPAEAAQLLTSVGAAYIERGQPERAVRALADALQRDPGLYEASLFRGVAFELLAQPDAALAAFTAARTASPGDPVAAYLVARRAPADADATDLSPLALALLSIHVPLMTESATEPRRPFFHTPLIEDGAASRPAFLPALYAPLVEQLTAQRYDDAVETARTLTRRDPTLLDPALSAPATAQAMAFLQESQPAAALAALETLEGPAARSSEARRLRARAFRALGRVAEALTHLREAVKTDTWNERAWLDLAVMVAERDQAEAETVLEEALTHLPQSGEVAWMLAQVRYALDRPNVAESLRIAVRPGPLAGAGHVWALLAQYLTLEWDLSSEDAFTRNVALNPNNAGAHLLLGNFLRAQGRVEHALAEYIAALLIQPGEMDAHLAIAQIHVDAERFAPAIAVLRHVVTHRPDLAEAHYALGNALLRSGEADEGRAELAIFKTLLEARSQATRRRYQITALRDTARLAEADGRFEEAADLRARIVGMDPDNVAHHVALAQTYVQLGRLPLATQHLEQAGKLNGPPVVYELLATLYRELGLEDESRRASQQFERRRQETQVSPLGR